MEEHTQCFSRTCNSRTFILPHIIKLKSTLDIPLTQISKEIPLLPPHKNRAV